MRRIYEEKLEAAMSVIEQITYLPIYLPEYIRDQIDDLMKFKPCHRCHRHKPIGAYEKRKTKDEYFDCCIECTDKNRARLG